MTALNLFCSQGTPQLTGSAVVMVAVADLNNNPPQFSQQYSISVLESTVIGSVVTMITATDSDSNAVIRLSLVSNPGNYFSINTITGALTVVKKLNWNIVREIILRVAANDGVYNVETSVEVIVVDVNDNAPIFQRSSYNIQLTYGQPIEWQLAKLNATDADSPGPNSQIIYRLAHPSKLFDIDENTGILYSTVSSISIYNSSYNFNDYSFQLTVMASDCGLPSLSNNVPVSISFLPPPNQFTPIFLGSNFNVTIPESTAVGSTIGRLSAMDFDVGVNGQVTYSIIAGNTLNQFSIGSVDGYITVIKQLDYLQVNNYVLTIMARDGAYYSKYATKNYTVYISRANNHPPVFQQTVYNCSIFVDVAVGSTVCKIVATDEDLPPYNVINYSLIGQLPLSGMFVLDATSGVISTKQKFDTQLMNQYELVVKATDSQGVYSATVPVGIVVLSVNKIVPKFLGSTYNFNITSSDAVGALIGYVSATDADWGLYGNCEYYFIGDSNLQGVSLNAQTGALTVNSDLSRQVASKVILNVLVTNPGIVNGSWSDTANIVLLMRGSRTAPYFLQSLYSATVLEDAVPGTSIVTVTAIESDSGGSNVQFIYTFLDGNTDGLFSIDNSGLIKTVTYLVRDVGFVYQLSVAAIDSRIPPMTGKQ